MKQARSLGYTVVIYRTEVYPRRLDSPFIQGRSDIDDLRLPVLLVQDVVAFEILRVPSARAISSRHPDPFELPRLLGAELGAIRAVLRLQDEDERVQRSASAGISYRKRARDG